VPCEVRKETERAQECCTCMYATFVCFFVIRRCCEDEKSSSQTVFVCVFSGKENGDCM
jgi:hypothetical protein